ncbi:MAG: isocitrate lyase/PEP mutase family protein [Planctomycetaceae bacterium]|nr:isocitrate lyase/PEP mutase family protein [Planctomycetaceae bacterium]
MKTTTAKRLRELLARPGLVRSLAAHDVLSALVMEQAGIELLFLGGFGVAASRFGWPDIGLVTLNEMTEAVQRLADRVQIPVIADGDTGHGDLQNVARTVREFEVAGAAGVLLEDQVSPKRCGHFANKQVIPSDEMTRKLGAALEARQDPDFIILARTDALAIEGANAAIDRSNKYGEIGADLCFIEAPETMDDLERIPKEVSTPLLANMLTGGRTPIVAFETLEEWGYKIAVCPIASLLLTAFHIRRLAETLKTQGRVEQLANEMFSFEDLKKLLGDADWMHFE